ncbi:MAG: alpha-glucosidase family protein [Maricaulaceae bacterium]
MTPWWKGAVIYQIYPRSFFDSDQDGVGDLPGVTEKLDYVANLGVDGIWLSPFFTSPMRDFGYDVADYYAVDPLFGSLDDFDALVMRAHALHLKVIIDQVYSHTSDRHPWFLESRANQTNDKADWYVWADAKPDGTPPNNWLSFFGGPAWSWDTQRRQYYLHNYLSEQPDLNFHNPEVQEAILDVAKFWLDRGVDGFRLDVANYYFHDPQLRDNPSSGASRAARPYHFQRHIFNRSRPETLSFLARLRQTLDGYAERMSVAEIASTSHIARSIEYTEGGDRLHTAYNFLFLESDELTPGLIRQAVSQWSSQDAWPSWSFSNHDVVRAVTRWGGRDGDEGFSNLLIALLCCLRGTIFLYQGEELGLSQADVPFDKLQDPEAIRFWPANLGRDGCRTPMPWVARSVNAGFSTRPPWLPVDPRHEAKAVDLQEITADSTLNFTRKMLALRRHHDALRTGEMICLDIPEPVLAFERISEVERIICVFNLSGSPTTLPVSALPALGASLDSGLEFTREAEAYILPAYGGGVALAKSK